MSARCRFCDAPLDRVFVDLGESPLANSFLKAEQLNDKEPYFPLKAFVCEKCFLVQLEPFVRPEEIFDEYVYFSSYSESWLKHAERYMAAMVERLSLNDKSQVVEVASNDGYLLQYFRRAGIPVLGIEPARTVADAAAAKGIPTWKRFFGVETAKQVVADKKQADLLVGNNVLAHVPDLNDFVAGLAIATKPGGTITVEFPHLMQLVENTQFDTIYHEHFSYFSFVTAERVFAAHGLTIYDVEEIPTHGGSLRIYAGHKAAFAQCVSARAKELAARERGKGYETAAAYEGLGSKAPRIKTELRAFLNKEKLSGKSIVAYGAAAKGNTLLNYCGVGSDFIDYVVDTNPHKQGLFLPGTHLPVFAPDRIAETKPDYILILPWNIQDEIVAQLDQTRSWGARFVVAIPSLKVF